MSVRDDPSAPEYPAPAFEGFAIQTAGPHRRGQVRRMVRRELGKGWKVTRFGDERTDFEVTPKRARLAVGEAWAATYRLRAQPGVVYAEPVFALSLSNRLDWIEVPPQGAGEGVGRAAAAQELCFEPEPLPESADPTWSLKQVRVFEAWERFFPGQGSNPGEGVIVGHPDTGYRRHPEIVGNLLIERGYDFEDADPDPEDELEAGPLLNPGHGTATASVIVSPKGVPGGNAAVEGVTGVAPGAKLIPLRVARSVVLLLSAFNLARAIEHAADQGAQVISISMGGLFNWRLRKAVVYAQKRGVIVLAAAGNCVRFVVWPAAYDEVIAVAASNVRRQTWRGSSRGSTVDVTAPGESVWCARADRGDAGGVERGSGTSFAVATVAGIAALWLARHGREQLSRRYGLEKIPFIFNQILRDSCVTVDDPTWEPGSFGAGLVDAEAALAAPLPNALAHPVVAPAFALGEHLPVDNGGEATFAHLFERALGGTPGAGRADPALRAPLAAILRTTEADLPLRLKEVGQELAFHLAVNPALYRHFEAALSREPSPPAAFGEARAAAPADDAVERVRDTLLSGGLSPALRTRLAG